MTRPHPLTQPPGQTLAALYAAARDSKTLSDDWIRVLEESVGGRYHGHTQLDLGAISIFMTNPRSCVTRAQRTIRVDILWGDTSVAAAYLDVDSGGGPLTLDIFPKWSPTRR